MTTLAVMKTPSNVRRYNLAEASADRMIELAADTGAVSRYRPLWNDTDWWIEVFGDSEADLEHHRDQLARRYRRLWLKPWAFTGRRRTKDAYASVEAMLTRGHGLSTDWL